MSTVPFSQALNDLLKASTREQDAADDDDEGVTVCASAPGKVILFGEHAVVYGQPAIAAALSDLRIRVQLTVQQCIPNERATVEVYMPDVSLHVRLRFAALAQQLERLPLPPTPNVVPAIRQFLQRALAETNLVVVPTSAAAQPQQLNEQQFNCLLPVVYLLQQLAPESFWKTAYDGETTTATTTTEPGKSTTTTTTSNHTTLRFVVRSQSLPVGAGLGSSAAFSVALTAALLKWRIGTDSQGRFTDSLRQPSAAELEEINRYAYASEILLHGTPSGIDNAVATHGGALWYTKKVDPATGAKNVTLETLEGLPHLRLLLVHTHVPRSTKELVAGVASLQSRHARVVDALLQVMGEIATEFRDWLRVPQGRAVLELVQMNHDCLRSLGVSHPRLERICEVTSRVAPAAHDGSQRAAAKLTGAGGGGCAMILLKPGMSAAAETATMEDLQKALSRERPKYTCFSSTVGGEGVRWEDPAALAETSEKDQQKTSVSKGILDMSWPWKRRVLAFCSGFVISIVWKLWRRRR